MYRLDGKTALVTGGSRGIGRAIAEALGKLGANVLVHYGRSKPEADKVVHSIESAGGKAIALGGDLGGTNGAFDLAAAVKAAVGEHLDILVANAGVSKAGAMDSYTIDDFDNLFATNVRAPFFLVQQLLPMFKEGSNIIVTTSLVAKVATAPSGQPGAPQMPAYAATKGALDTLVKHWAGMLGPQGIRVNAVAPGIIATEMSTFTKTESGQKIAYDLQALKRLGTPEDIADVVAFLASDGARWITGASIPVDGGSKL